MAVDASDEQRHQPGPTSDWIESWHFDFWDEALSVGGYAGVALRPHARAASFWGCVVGAGRALVAVVEHDVPVPRPPALELRASGLWVDVILARPFEHATIGLEAFAVEVADPLEMLGRGFGDRVPLGFDLEWETAGVDVVPIAGGYGLPGVAHGEILVGEERIELDGWGWRDHQWGTAPTLATARLAGRFDDGSSFSVSVSGRSGASGSVAGEPVDGSMVTILEQPRSGSSPLPESIDARIGSLDITAQPVLWAPHLVPWPAGAGSARPVARAVCSVSDQRGRHGTCWWARTSGSD